MTIKQQLLGIIHLFRGSPIKRAYDALQEAMRTHARYLAEAEYHMVMAKFYAMRLENIDPHLDPTHAWDFADAMQKRYDEQLEWEREHKRSLEAYAKVTACQERLHKLKVRS